MPLEESPGLVNATGRGWVGYFHFKNCGKVLKHVRLRTYLRKRFKVRERKTDKVRFGKLVLCKTYGLYNVPTEAGWTKMMVRGF